MKLRVAVALFATVAILTGCTSPAASTVGGPARRERTAGRQRAGHESVRQRGRGAT